jgi:hypothetical protein
VETDSRKRPEAAGNGVWDLRPWCDQFGIAISTYYTLKAKPRSTRVGRLLKISASRRFRSSKPLNNSKLAARAGRRTT